jgi:magnesium transporter
MHGDTISKSLIEETVSKKKLAHNIYRMKHVLIDYLNVLWATKDVIESLRNGDSDLITNNERLLGRIGMLSALRQHRPPQRALRVDVKCAGFRA